MSVSVMLRLASEALAAGRLAGEAELVATGERALVANAEQLIAFVARHLDGEHDAPPRAASPP